jgi:alkanesulfonate monooxygenase SsuD/methylene tetrahydromethanopterin reductase-like flavin-dependent oxidoreductase (luciferase family)
LIPKLWTSDGPITFEGKYTTLRDREVFPKPLQKPHPPIWAAATSPSSYTLAGELGLGVLGFGTGIGPDAVTRRVAEYQDALACATPVGAVNENVGLFMLTYCASTDAEARKNAEPAFMGYLDKTMEHFLQWGRGGDLPPGYEWYAEASRKSQKLAEHMKFDYLFESGMVLVGSPDTICANIERYQDAGVTQILTGTQFAGITQEQALTSMRLFAETVLPEFSDVETLAATP